MQLKSSIDMATTQVLTQQMFRVFNGTERGREAQKLMRKSKRLSKRKDPLSYKRSREAGRQAMRILLVEAQRLGLKTLEDYAYTSCMAMAKTDNDNAERN